MAANLLTSVHDAVKREYDYIVVGGGTAGLVVASRLSEDPSVTVLVLEAGRANLNEALSHSPSPIHVAMSGTFGKNFFNPDYEWGFMTVPQKHSNDTPFYWPRGKGLGGSSSINFYVFTHPPASDIDAIEKLGNPGWNWETVPTVLKEERTEAEAERLHYDPAHHGTDGPIATCYAPLRTGWDNLYQDALGNLGLPPAKDSTQGDGNAAWMATCSVSPKTNRRSYAVVRLPQIPPSDDGLLTRRDVSQEYLEQAGSRKNLHVVVSSPVTRVLFKDEKSATGDAVASGVEFVNEGKKYTARAKRRSSSAPGEQSFPILRALHVTDYCDSTLKTPQILEFSGVGNPEILTKIGVKTKIDLPSVGENVQEHTFCSLGWELKEPEKYNTLDSISDEAVLKEQLQLYEEQKGLFLLSILGIGTGSLARLSPDGAALTAAQEARIRATPAESWRPGIAEQYQLQLDKLSTNAASLEIVSMPTFISRPNPPAPGKKYLTYRVGSEPSVVAREYHPLAPPTLDPHYYEDEFDLQNMIELVKFTRRLGKTSPLSDIVAREHNPGPEIQTDEELIAWIKQFTNSIAHTSGTCSMLPRDKGGVVDPRLKVYGTHNLRVVDLSVLPLQIGAPTQTFVYALAEQASDIIKGVI
ncbi:GMC oxidoreductase [Lactarius psammicola]|nr:GMC oxidoreductase [Lactarius psammicola]